MSEISLTLSEAIKRTGISRSSFYRLFAEKRLVPRKSGKRILILADELDAFVRSLPAAEVGRVDDDVDLDVQHKRHSKWGGPQ
ncbi:helix-turn-helix domain-containing protein [Mesorhizobium sp. AR02]|uniref:helix-turn-helix domain-containing protein n=1 Tax=Mesorhizobium sp. AR02 TaxID=2865837 RepID=UPI00215EC862|nr:helix-turn-helix domain-containing protein [Mesorhizobium sp. AR02]UVK50957.1 helix-turn-helix domain-containing protein [Mesorhizobium sp. AR02]